MREALKNESITNNNPSMEQTWRWYGPMDSVTLLDISQAGATGVVTALHEVPIGDIWQEEDITKRKNLIEQAGLTWTVIESVPVHEEIKLGGNHRDKWIENFKESLRNISKLGIQVVTYNWMPVVDWTRTNLSMELQNGAQALLFDMREYVAFDLFILKRHGAEKDYTKNQIDQARLVYDSMTIEKQKTLQNNIIAGLPGGQEGYSLEDFKARLAAYKNIDKDTYVENLRYFLDQIIPLAEELNIKMAIHPDDPPFSLFGLPRIVSTESDLLTIFNMVDSVSNGFCFCTGSLGVLNENNLPNMIKKLGDRIHFLHLRSTHRSEDGSFYEAGHLEGDVDMYHVITEVIKQQRKRFKQGRDDYKIPMRPDHGHTMLDDLKKKVNPGYSGIGRLKGLAEIRGLEHGIVKSNSLVNA